MKKTLAILLTLSMLICCVPSFGCADSTGDITGSIDNMPFVYNDTLFSGNASQYNTTLSVMSCCLADSGYANSYYGWENQTWYTQTFLKSLGFSDLLVNEYNTVKPEMDSMGVTVGLKDLSSGEKLLVIVPRSTGYLAEWASNFTIGKSGDSEGFSNSATIVEQFVNEYVDSRLSGYKGTLKVWVVGYSRGAAVANLVAGRFTMAGKIGNVPVEKENIFGYTYETPAGLNASVCSIEKAQSCTNIHNIISTNDVVTKVAPKGWGFIRYGTDEYVIPETRTVENEDLFEAAVGYLPKSYCTTDTSGNRIALTETFQAKKLNTDPSILTKMGNWELKNGLYVWTPIDTNSAIELMLVDTNKSMSAVLDDLIKAAEIGIGSRDSYARNVESAVRVIISEFLGDNYQTQTFEKAKAILQEELEKNENSIIAAALSGNISYLENILTGIVDRVVSGANLDTEDFDNIVTHAINLVPILARTAVADAAIDNCVDIISIIENIDILFKPHMINQCYAFLRAADDEYKAAVLKQKAAEEAEKARLEKIANAKVTDLKVELQKVKTTKKILFVKTTITNYVYTIKPVSITPVKNISYRTTLVGNLTSGSQISRDYSLGYIYICVTDANGTETKWEYKAGKIKQVK